MPVTLSGFRGLEAQRGSALLAAMIAASVVATVAWILSQKITDLEKVIRKDRTPSLQNYLEANTDSVSTIALLGGYRGLNKNVGDFVVLCPRANPAVIDTSSSAGYLATSMDYRCATIANQFVNASANGTTLVVEGKTHTVRAVFAGKTTKSSITSYKFDIQARNSSGAWTTSFTLVRPTGPCSHPTAGVPCVNP